MKMSIVLKTFCYFFLQITLLLSILFLLRGHNNPGGGFIGALIATTGIGFYIIVYGRAPSFVRGCYQAIIAWGIVCLVSCFLLTLLTQKPLLSANWQVFYLFGQKIKVGTPLLFDIGIFLTVLGSLVWAFACLEESYD